MGFRSRLLSFVEIWLIQNCSIYMYLLYRLGKKLVVDRFSIQTNPILLSSQLDSEIRQFSCLSFSPTRRTFAKKEKKKMKDGRSRFRVEEESGRCFDRGTLLLSILGSTRECIGRRETCGQGFSTRDCFCGRHCNIEARNMESRSRNVNCGPCP